MLTGVVDYFLLHFFLILFENNETQTTNDRSPLPTVNGKAPFL